MMKTHPALPALTVEDLDDARRVAGMLLGLLPEIGILLVDAKLRVRLLAGEVHMLRETSEETVIGRRVDEILLPRAWDALEGQWAVALAGETTGLDWVSLDGVAEDWLHFAPLRTAAGQVIGAAMITQDISERWKAHRRLERQLVQQAAIVTLGSMALQAAPTETLMQEAARLVEVTLEADFSAVLPYLATGGLEVRGASGKTDLRGPDPTAPAEPGQIMDHMRDADEPLLVADLRVSTLRAPILESEGMVSLAVAAIGPPTSRYGLLGACSRTAEAFSTADLAFVQSLANVLAEAVERERAGDEAQRREARLNESQRDLERSEERFRQGFDGAPIGMALVSPDSGLFLRVNDAYCRLVGRPAAELLTMVYTDVLHPDEGSTADHDEFESGRTAVFVRDRRYLRPDESVAWGAVNVSRVLGPDGGVDVLFVQVLDVTERHAKEEATRRELADVAWVGEIHAALAEDRFELYAQPIVDLATGEIVQRELLLRMHSTSGELVAPGEFLPTAERFGVIRDIDRWVISRGAELAATGMNVEVNISGTSIGDVGLLDEIDRALERTGADPALMVFEITETALIESADTARLLAERLRERGCRFALDDFGTGFAGLSSLKTLPLDYLKIDQGFVRDLCVSESDRHVVRAVIDLARGFGLQTIAEGVEDEATLDLLRELGVDHAQGYFLGRPAPLDQIADATPCVRP